MSVCSRSGCTKSLRKDNSKGVCSSGCLSLDAPPVVRAKELRGVVKPVAVKEIAPVKAEPVIEVGTAAARFRAVHDAMGMDPAATLEEFYASWLEGIKQALES